MPTDGYCGSCLELNWWWRWREGDRICGKVVSWLQYSLQRKLLMVVLRWSMSRSGLGCYATWKHPTLRNWNQEGPINGISSFTAALRLLQHYQLWLSAANSSSLHKHSFWHGLSRDSGYTPYLVHHKDLTFHRHRHFGSNLPSSRSTTPSLHMLQSTSFHIQRSPITGICDYVMW